MSRHPRICLVSGCPAIAVHGTSRCTVHPPPRSPSSVATSQAGWKTLRSLVLVRDGCVCVYCGGLATTADHVLSVANGGTNTLENLAASCWPCNRRKGANGSLTQ